MSPTPRDPLRLITAVAAFLALLISITLPIGYFLSAQRNLRTEAEGQAELLSRRMSRLVIEQPRGWRYLSHLDELVRRELRAEDAHTDTGAAAVLGLDGSVIARSGPRPAQPVLEAEAPVFDAGVKVAVVRFEHTMRPVLEETALAAALGLILAAAIFVTLRVFPLRALKRTIDELDVARGEAEARALELEQQGRETALVSQMTGVLQVAHSLDEAGQVIARTAAALFPGSAGALYLFRDSHALLQAVAAWGGREVGDAFAQEECWAMRRGRPHLSRDGGLEPMCAHGDASADIRFCVPLSSQGEMLGILHLCNQDCEPTKSCQVVAGRLADQLGLALGNLRLRESLKSMSIRDALTGLFNRRYLTETLGRELARARRASTSLAVIMLDVDHFKQFNDRFGHDGGDAVLRELGALLRPSVRADDIACRYGGEEFCLVLPQMDRDGARERAEAIRTAVARLEVKADGRALGPVTLSLGVAVFPDHAEDPDGLLRRADEALYEAKKGGRNRTVISGAAAQAHELREAATTT